MLTFECTIRVQLGSKEERNGSAMSDWIKRKDEEFRIARAKQDRRLNILPAKAEEMWRGLVKLIMDDVQQINSSSEITARIGHSLTFQHTPTSNELQVIKDLPLSKRVNVKFDKPAAIMSVTLYQRHNINQSETPQTMQPIGFDFADDGTVFFADSNGKPIDSEKISEEWLMPFLIS